MGVVETDAKLPPERDCAEQLNVSRVTLREAIKRSPADARRLARRLGASAVLDALAFRSVVEPGAAELAASRALDQPSRQRLKGALDAVRSAEGPARRATDSRLRILIGELSGSPTPSASVAEVHGRLDELLAAILVFARNMAHSDHQRDAFVRAILRGQPTAARTAIAGHVEGTEALLRGLLT